MTDKQIKPRARRDKDKSGLSPTEREFWTHFAQHGDWYAAYTHAYPNILKRQSLSAALSRIRSAPNSDLGWELVEKIRSEKVEEASITFGWVLNEAVKQYKKSDEANDVIQARAGLKFILRLIGTDNPKQLPPATVDGEFTHVPDDQLIRALGDQSGAIPPRQGEGADGLGRFREVLRRAPTSEAPPDTVHVPADGDGRVDEPSHGVHAPGGSKVDLLQRVRASVGRGATPGDCPDCGLPHDGPCPSVRETS